MSIHPEISWSIVLDVALRTPVDPSTVDERLRAGWPEDGRVGALPAVAVEAGSAWDRLVERMANVPYRADGPWTRILVSSDGDRLAVAGHHAVHDGLGLVALASAALGARLGTTARGLGAVEGSARRSGYAFGRLAEAVGAPPTRIAPAPAAAAATPDRRGDHLARSRVEGSVSTAGLVAGAAARRIGSWWPSGRPGPREMRPGSAAARRGSGSGTWATTRTRSAGSSVRPRRSPTGLTA